MKLFTQFPHPILTVNSFESVIIYHSQHSKINGRVPSSRWWHTIIMNSCPLTDSSYRQLHMNHILLKKKKKNPKNCLSHSHTSAEERSLWKQVEDAGPLTHQTLHTREGTWNPERLLKGFELHIRYLQILRPVPERWAPQTSSFKNQQR